MNIGKIDSKFCRTSTISVHIKIYFIMSTTFLYADPHFGHSGVCHFMHADGVSKLRPWDNPADMDEAMIELYNSTVRKNDKVYFMGDVVINRRALQTIGRLNGDKILIKGNHDVFRLEEYTPYFRDIRACHVLNGYILTHIPVHESQLKRFSTNLHGHLHSHRVKKAIGIDHTTGELSYSDENDLRYHCVSVEHTEFKPISLEDVKLRIVNEGGIISVGKGNR